MRIYTSNTHKQGHTDSAISPVFAWYYLRSQRYVEVSTKGLVSAFRLKACLVFDITHLNKLFLAGVSAVETSRHSGRGFLRYL